MKSNKELVYFVGKDKNDVNGEHCSLNILNIQNLNHFAIEPFSKITQNDTNNRQAYYNIAQKNF